jgi:hypothetical protein
MLAKGDQVANTPYQKYSGQMVAGFSPTQTAGMNMATQRAQQGDLGLNKATQMNNNVTDGKYLGQGVYQNQQAGLSSATRNKMAGQDNAYLQDVINNTNQDIAGSFTESVMPQTDANFARGGAFGGSAWRKASENNSRQLADALAKNTSNLRYQDFDQQRNLEESYAQRQAQDIINRQNFGESLAQRQTQGYDTERNRMMSGIQNAQNLSQLKYKDADVLMQLGGMQQKQNQNVLDNQYNQYLEKKNYPTQQLDVLSALVARAMGTGNSSISTSTNPNNRYASGLGGAIAGGTAAYGAANALGGGEYAGLLGALGAAAGGAAGMA